MGGSTEDGGWGLVSHIIGVNRQRPKHCQQGDRPAELRMIGSNGRLMSHDAMLHKRRLKKRHSKLVSILK